MKLNLDYTGDDNAVYGKQYIVFDENDVKPT